MRSRTHRYDTAYKYIQTHNHTNINKHTKWLPTFPIVFEVRQNVFIHRNFSIVKFYARLTFLTFILSGSTSR